MNKKRYLAVVGLGVLLALPGAGSASARQVTVDAKMLEQLQQLVREQQKQLDSLQRQVDTFQQTAVAAQSQAEEARTVAEEVKTATQGDKTVVSGSPRVKLAISGQVNRAVNLADDGDTTDAYFVDNDASNTRVRFIGTADVADDLLFGSTLEIGFSPNNSSKVSQDHQRDSSSNDVYDERVAEIYLKSKQYGNLYFGKGSTASDGTAEIDLSHTDIVQYSSYAGIAGGLKFRQSKGDELSGASINDVFSNYDGQSRRSRIRYDLPIFYGFGLAGSVISDRRWDTALRWNGSGYGFEVASGVALGYINEDNYNYQYDGSVSILHTDTGLNFTFSGGAREAKSGDNPYALYGKLG
ncbi:MAG: porin [Desulfopila sp.]